MFYQLWVIFIQVLLQSNNVNLGLIKNKIENQLVPLYKRVQIPLNPFSEVYLLF